MAGTLNHPKFMYKEHPLTIKKDLHRCCNVKVENQGIEAQMYSACGLSMHFLTILHHYLVSPMTRKYKQK